MRNNNWYCVKDGCNTVLGVVSGNELYPSENMPADHVSTYGPNLMVKCPECQTRKLWYTADPVTRAVYQLIDAMAGAMATRTVKKVSEKTLKTSE